MENSVAKKPTIIDGSAKIDSNVIGEGCSIGPNVIIFYEVKIGHETDIKEGSTIGQYSRIGNKVSIGKNLKMGPFATIMDNVIIGDNVVIDPFARVDYDQLVPDGARIKSAWTSLPRQPL